ncbi:hypothetical protein D8674_028501 [Pyrus ussuriensis x Pyrus communis]|uniref:Uncharacterized protein n=1 Tax=Pyrus ussuriensis x Pyrus communis TaxID=2448454 RepID=A0A5N5I9V2_9ROSA|nr:hypothetical protein D8674_028501 [Pyrus ussuriensis x Pyrus communis]
MGMDQKIQNRKRRENGDFAKFRDVGIELEEKLDQMFMNATATGKHSCVPSSGVLRVESGGPPRMIGGKKRAFHPLSTDATKQEKENGGGAAEFTEEVLKVVETLPEAEPGSDLWWFASDLHYLLKPYYRSTPSESTFFFTRHLARAPHAKADYLVWQQVPPTNSVTNRKLSLSSYMELTYSDVSTPQQYLKNPTLTKATNHPCGSSLPYSKLILILASTLIAKINDNSQFFCQNYKLRFMAQDFCMKNCLS